jgi:hypothetical protein
MEFCFIKAGDKFKYQSLKFVDFEDMKVMKVSEKDVLEHVCHIIWSQMAESL